MTNKGNSWIEEWGLSRICCFCSCKLYKGECYDAEGDESYPVCIAWYQAYYRFGKCHLDLLLVLVIMVTSLNGKFDDGNLGFDLESAESGDS